MFVSIASESPGKASHESQLLLSSWNEPHQRTARHVLDVYSSSYSEWNVDDNWSQEWKSDELMEVKTGRLVYEHPPGLFAQYTDIFLLMRMMWTLTLWENQTRRLYPDHSCTG